MFSKSHFSKITIISFALAAAVSLTFIAKAQDIMRSPQYRMEDSYLEIQETSPSKIISLSKEENGKEEVVSQVMIIDSYLISSIPENEFLNKYSRLQSGFQNLKISIEADQPLFKKENFYHPSSLFEKTKVFLGFETLPEYRLIKEIKNNSGNLETNLKIPGLDFKTSYRKVDEEISNVIDKGQKIKQNLFFENNSENEINFQLTLTHSFEASSVFFGGEEYLISENPQFLSPQMDNSISFSSDGQQYFTYDFSDLLDYNPEIWVFKRGSENILLVKIHLSLLPHSSITIDPGYTVDTSTAANATAYSFQRKTWWDGSRYWVGFWSDADNRIEFHYSATGSSWAENTSARLYVDSNDFSIIGDSLTAFIIYSDGTDVHAAAAEGYPAADFIWAATTTVFTSQGPGGTVNFPHMDRDSSSYIWATARDFDSESYIIVAVRSTNADDVTAWEGSSNLDTSANSNKYGVISQSDNEETVWAVWIDGTVIEGKEYEGSWGNATTIGTGVSGLTKNMSVTYYDTGYLHLTYIGGGEPSSVVNYRSHRDVGGWQTIVELDTNEGNSYTTISLNTSSDAVYAFWERLVGSNYTIFYKKGISTYESSSWDGTATAWQTSTAVLTWVDSNLGDDTKIYAAWMEGGKFNTVKWGGVSTTAGNVPPTVGTVLLNGGSNITLAENATTAVSATATVTDTDGYGDISSVEGKIYRSAVGSGCSANDNNCYLDSSCATSSCSGNSCTATCDYDVWFHADPTDNAVGNPYSAQYWAAWIKAIDTENASSTATSSQEMNSLAALDVSTSSINYGDVGAGQDTGTLSETTTITTTGNAAIDIYLYSTDLDSGAATIAVGYQEYATDTLAYGNGTDATSSTSNAVEVDLSKPTSHPSTSTDDIYWGIGIPGGQTTGTYSGTTTFEAKSD